MRIDAVDPAAAGIFVDPRIFEHRRVVDFLLFHTHGNSPRIRRGGVNSPWHSHGFALAGDPTAGAAGGDDRVKHATVVVENDVLDFADCFALR